MREVFLRTLRSLNSGDTGGKRSPPDKVQTKVFKSRLSTGIPKNVGYIVGSISVSVTVDHEKLQTPQYLGLRNLCMPLSLRNLRLLH